MLKEAGKIIGNFLLIILAIIIVIIVTVLAFLWLITMSMTGGRSVDNVVYGISAYFLAIASSIDKFGNCAFGGFFNDVLLASISYSFGYNYETISAVVGWNYLFGTLGSRGMWLYKSLNKLESDHCELAVVGGIISAQLRLEKFEELKELKPNQYKEIKAMVDLAMVNKHELRIDTINS